jgi:hypothetical protein
MKNDVTNIESLNQPLTCDDFDHIENISTLLRMFITYISYGFILNWKKERFETQFLELDYLSHSSIPTHSSFKQVSSKDHNTPPHFSSTFETTMEYINSS